MKNYLIESTVSKYAESVTTANIREYIRNHFDLKTSYTAHRSRYGFDICDRIGKEVIYTITVI